MQSVNLTLLKLQYPYERPKSPIQIYLLAGLIIIGLIALFLAAVNAFDKVVSLPQAVMSALLIEAGLVIESLTLMRKPKAIFPYLAIALALAVSGTYNYMQVSGTVATNEALILSNWQMLSLALGPLLALGIISLTLGDFLKDYQNKEATWERERATWVEAEKLRLEAEAKAERVRQARRQAARERKAAAKTASVTDILPERQDGDTGNYRQLPERAASWASPLPENLAEFKRLVRSGDLILPPNLTGQRIAEAIPAVGSARTGRNWLNEVQYEKIGTNGHRKSNGQSAQAG